jgi:hypothetical protein
MLPDRSITVFKINRFSTADRVYDVRDTINDFLIEINIILDGGRKDWFTTRMYILFLYI